VSRWSTLAHLNAVFAAGASALLLARLATGFAVLFIPVGALIYGLGQRFVTGRGTPADGRSHRGTGVFFIVAGLYVAFQGAMTLMGLLGVVDEL
jgi:hypothetical protein